MPIDSQYYADAKKLEDDIAAFMQSIIRIPSLSSQEGAAQGIFCKGGMSL